MLLTRTANVPTSDVEWVMKSDRLSVAGPYTHENLSIFLLRGIDSCDGSRFIPLDEAMEQKAVIVHETGNVGELEIESLSELLDLYVQAGDVVKGGRQDRTFGVDFVLPPKSGRVPIPSFCVESGRWHQRASEKVRSFSSSKSCLARKKLRLAAKLGNSQNEVWKKVAEMQEDLSLGLDKSLYDAASPTSYQLTVENKDLQKRKQSYRAALEKILQDVPNAVGYAFAINGEINTADVYGSGMLFRKLWNKLLDAAVLEAIAEPRRKGEIESPPVTASSIREWFREARLGRVSGQQEVPPRVRVETRRSKRSILFDTFDHGINDAVIHRNLVAK